MLTKINLDWFFAALARAIKTIAQTALGMFTVGAAINEINWTYVISVSVVAGVYSMLTSVATTLPETASDGVIKIDQKDGVVGQYLLSFNDAVETVKKKAYVRLKVDNSTM